MSQAGRFALGSGSGAPIETLTGNVGGPVSPDAAFNIDVPGSHGITTTGNPGTSTITFALDNTITLGDLAPVVGDSLTLTTGDETITAGDLNLTAGNINLANANAGATQGIINFNSIRFLHNYSNDPTNNPNIFLGNNAGNFTTTAVNNIGIGDNALNSLSIPALSGANTAVGHQALASLTTGDRNVMVGNSGFRNGISGASNTGIGWRPLFNATTGSFNISIGSQSSLAYTGAESSNICINSDGVLGESNVLRVGATSGTGDKELNESYIHGIYQRTPSGVSEPVVIDNNGQLGSVALTNGQLLIGSTASSPVASTITAGSNVSIANGPGSITISASGSSVITYTAVNTTPYQPTINEYFLGVDSSGAPITIELPDAPPTGEVWVIKDSTGSAVGNNITVTTVGGVVNIDGAATFVMNTAYEAIQVVFNGASYEVF